MSDYTAHNSKVFKVGVEQYAERVIKAKLVAMLKSVAQTLVGVIDGSFVMPDGTTQFPVNIHSDDEAVQFRKLPFGNRMGSIIFFNLYRTDSTFHGIYVG